MKLYDYVFCIIYLQLNKTNKSIPEWGTIFVISAIQLVNIMTILIYNDVDFASISNKEFSIGAFVLVLINWTIFVYKSRYKKILKTLNKRITWLKRILVFAYLVLSIFALFWTERILYLPILITILLLLIILFQSKSFWKDWEVFESKVFNHSSCTS